MIIRSVEFNPYTLEVKGFDLESKTIRVKVENSVYITYETDSKELLYIMSCSFEFDEICKLLERRIKNIEHSKNLDDYIERKEMIANKIRDLMRDSYCEDENVFLELEELERLSKIGRAIEKALEHRSMLIIDYFFWNGGYEGEYEFETIEELIKWYSEEKK